MVGVLKTDTYQTLADRCGIPSLRHLLTSEHIQRSHNRGFGVETGVADLPYPLAILFYLDRQAGFLITLEIGSLSYFIIRGHDGR